MGRQTVMGEAKRGIKSKVWVVPQQGLFKLGVTRRLFCAGPHPFRTGCISYAGGSPPNSSCASYQLREPYSRSVIGKRANKVRYPRFGGVLGEFGGGFADIRCVRTVRRLRRLPFRSGRSLPLGGAK